MDSRDSLTEGDASMLERIVDDMIEAGLWHRVSRAREGHRDLFSVHKKGVIGPVLGIGRSHGRYIVIDHVGGSVRFGRTLSEALAYAGLENPPKKIAPSAVSGQKEVPANP